MKTKRFISDLIRFGKENDIDTILLRRPILMKFGAAFGSRPISSITSHEINDFVLRFRIRIPNKMSRWDGYFQDRYIKKSIHLLPWELIEPVRALTKLFSRKSFHPKTALDIGCGE